MIDEVIKGRRSISSFTEKAVPVDLVEEIIDVASYAPSSCNTQPWFFLVFHTSESKEKLNSHIAKGYEYTRESFKKKHKLMGGVYTKLLDFFSIYGKFDKAPVYILLFARPYDAPVFSQAIKFGKDEDVEKIAEDSVVVSAALAMQNFLLVAHDRGLGTRVKDGIKFLRNFESLSKDFYKEFKIPKDYKLISGIQLGYPDKKSLGNKAASRISKKKTRKFI